MTLLDPAAFGAFVEGYQFTAYRLETRESYSSPPQEKLDAFLAGQLHDESWLDDWLGLVVRKKVLGAQMERVRVVSEPWSDYTRLGLHLSRLNVAAGEDIRYLARTRADKLGLPEFDYWLIDGDRACTLRFADDGAFLGGELLDDPAAIVKLHHYREIARHHAQPRAAYLQHVTSHKQTKHEQS